MTRLSDLVRQPAHRVPPTPDATAMRAAASDSAHRWYAAAREELRRLRGGIRANCLPSIEPCRALAMALVEELRQSDDCLRLALAGRSDDYLVDNALHVAVVSVKLGLGLRYAGPDLERVASAALLHDVGMWALPDALTQKAGPLTTEEQVAVRAHPERGRRLLADVEGPDPWLSIVCAQEHERWDGSGYPCRLAGAMIHEHAQLIGAADVLDALITPRPYKTAITPHQALREMLVHGKGRFSHRVLKALGDHITIYPVGTTVRLNTGVTGTVSRINPRYPLRPTIAVAAEASGGASRSELDLAAVASAYIIEVLHPPGVS